MGIHYLVNKVPQLRNTRLQVVHFRLSATLSSEGTFSEASANGPGVSVCAASKSRNSLWKTKSLKAKLRRQSLVLHPPETPVFRNREAPRLRLLGWRSAQASRSPASAPSHTETAWRSPGRPRKQEPASLRWRRTIPAGCSWGRGVPPVAARA